MPGLEQRLGLASRKLGGRATQPAQGQSGDVARAEKTERDQGKNERKQDLARAFRGPAEDAEALSVIGDERFGEHPVRHGAGRPQRQIAEKQRAAKLVDERVVDVLDADQEVGRPFRQADVGVRRDRDRGDDSRLAVDGKDVAVPLGELEHLRQNVVADLVFGECVVAPLQVELRAAQFLDDRRDVLKPAGRRLVGALAALGRVDNLVVSDKIYISSCP